MMDFDKLKEMYRKVFGVKVTRLANEIFKADCVITGLVDSRLPLKAISGLYNVRPYNCETTQVHTANWPHGAGCFFFELKGSWTEVPPPEVIVLSGDGEVYERGDFRPLAPDEQVQALQFMRDNWPEGGAKPSVKLVRVEKAS